MRSVMETPLDAHTSAEGQGILRLRLIFALGREDQSSLRMTVANLGMNVRKIVEFQFAAALHRHGDL
jgi:hypothetical protein